MNDSRSKNASANGLQMMSKTLWKLQSLLFIILCCHNSFGQVPDQTNKHAEIVISGARFMGDLMKHWIKEYEAGNPQVKFVLEDKGTVEFSEADIIIHGHQPSKAQIYENRTYISFARFAVLPIANVNSPFAKVYAEKGLKKSELKQAFFFNPLDRIDEKPLKIEFNAYSRIQQASAPIVFAKSDLYPSATL